MSEYKSQFTASPQAERILRDGRIIENDETPAGMIERVTATLAAQEALFTDSRESGAQFAEAFGELLDTKQIIMSTPIMTNAGRHNHKPLTACTVPTFNLDPINRSKLRDEIIHLHEQGMGTGFNLDETTDPVMTLRELNRIAVDSANSGKEDRPVGNMAILSVTHPAVIDFINVKREDSSIASKFNISIDLSDAFMHALDTAQTLTLDDGRVIDPESIFRQICEAAAASADPGVIFLDRMNNRNPLPLLGEYRTTAPCAEVGLIEGETCQFGYINLGKFVSINSLGQPVIDFEELETTTRLMTRALDNSLQISQSNLTGAQTRNISELKRKIGIGLCGVADALSITGIAYDSPEARTMMSDVLSFINFASKQSSIQLAKERGSFGAMKHMVGNRHRETPGHIESLYGDKDSGTVAAEDWRKLAAYIKETGLLRNVSTIALPPTGRSALIIDASTGVEPHFRLDDMNPEVKSALDHTLQYRYGESVYDDPNTHSDAVQKILATARLISPMGHIGMVTALQRFTDESVAKTINLPEGSDASAVRDAYSAGYRAGMSGVTVYVDGTHKIQPKQVK